MGLVESGKMPQPLTKLFTQWAGNEIKIDGKEYLVLKESDVIGIIEDTGSKKKAA